MKETRIDEVFCVLCYKQRQAYQLLRKVNFIGFKASFEEDSSIELKNSKVKTINAMMTGVESVFKQEGLVICENLSCQ